MLTNMEWRDRTKSNRTKNTITKWVATFICTVIASSPTILFFVLKNALSPEGFWQQFVVYGAGIYLLGTAQLIFLFIYIGVLFMVIWEN